MAWKHFVPGGQSTHPARFADFQKAQMDWSKLNAHRDCDSHMETARTDTGRNGDIWLVIGVGECIVDLALFVIPLATSACTGTNVCAKLSILLEPKARQAGGAQQGRRTVL